MRLRPLCPDCPRGLRGVISEAAEAVGLPAGVLNVEQAECLLSGQVCASLTRIVVSRPRHDDMVEALAAAFSKVRVGDPFDPASQMGPLAAERQRDRFEGYIAKGIEIGATLATGRGRRSTR